MRTLPIAAVLAASFLCSGCATFAHGPVENVAVTSTPPGAAIYVDGARTPETTPATVSVRRRRSTTIRIERTGYESQEIRLTRRGSRWLWLDLGICLNPLAIQGLDSPSQWPLVVLGCFGSLAGIDLLSGAAFAVQKHVSVDLKPVSASGRDETATSRPDRSSSSAR